MFFYLSGKLSLAFLVLEYIKDLLTKKYIKKSLPSKLVINLMYFSHHHRITLRHQQNMNSLSQNNNFAQSNDHTSTQS